MSSQKRTFTYKCTNKIQHTCCGIIEHKQMIVKALWKKKIKSKNKPKNHPNYPKLNRL